jgi:acyl-CoA synthetase (AMP-forming)/AMP-acid ligase II
VYTGRATLPQLIEAQTTRAPDAAAITAPGRLPLTYERLRLHLAETVARLTALGVGRSDRVAVVLPAGPELAVCLLAVGATAACAPLNPDYTSAEFAQYLDHLRPTALLTLAGATTPALGPARERGLRILELTPIPHDAAGLFDLSSPASASAASAPVIPAQPDDIALVLQTSGTTARPKIVPLTHANLTAAARNIVTVLRLDAADVCLNVMPVFHIHGFSALLSTLISGGRVVCPPGFAAPVFFDWVAQFHPTWYTAAPTIHQAILARARAHPEVLARCSFRFVRSASSGMPPPVLTEVERTLGAPFIEAYGMTEAAPQISSNQLPPAVRKPGSVGRPAGPEVAILDAAGHVLPPGSRGEVAVRGANITSGYEDDPEANAALFHDGWLRTGDEGYLDNEGYLFITGRLREMINRGGEKIAPREVDEALLAHAAVAEAAAFPVPHPTLGEEVAAAVVLRPGASATAEELRAFVAERLAYFKVPRSLVLVSALPKGPTAKLQRHEVAARLAHLVGAGGVEENGSSRSQPPLQSASQPPFVEPRTPLERKLAAIWAGVLEFDVERVGVHDDFFALGGDSMLATLVVSRLSDTASIELTLPLLFEAPTIAGLAARLTEQADTNAADRDAVVGPADLADLAPYLRDAPES